MNKPKVIQIIDIVSNAIAGNRIDEDFIKSCIYGKVNAVTVCASFRQIQGV